MEAKTVTKLCDWCRFEYTYTRSGPGQPPRYCSETCKKEGQNALAATRKHKQRVRQGDARPNRDPGRGRPTKRYV